MAEQTLVPIHDPNRGFRVWNITEIYNGPNTGIYVPNKNDMVLDWNLGFYIVAGIDVVTGLSRLEKWVGPIDDNSVVNKNQFLGVDINQQSESYRAYIDTSVVPHTLALDSRLHIYGSEAVSVKVFKGTNITDGGQVISAQYDVGGNLLGEHIPLELVLMPGEQNLAIKTPMTGYTMQQLDDGEVVTAVVYGDMGHALSYSTMLVKNTSFVRTTDASKKYIVSIHLESPLLANNGEDMLEFPVNMATDDIPATGVVTYSDGSVIKAPANAGRFKLYGLDHFITTMVGQVVPLVLTYQMADNEYSYGNTVGQFKHISKKYWGTTTEFEKAYSVKLYAFPRWVDDIHGYELDFFLANLDRTQIYNVNGLVEIAANSPSFQPLRYGIKQNLSFVIRMDKVSSVYPAYRYVQTQEITLMAPGIDIEPTKWLLGFTPNQEYPYGDGIYAKMQFINVSLSKVNMANGFGSLEEWLRNVFYETKPLLNTHTEAKAPTPNYMVLKTKNNVLEVPVTQWDQNIDIPNDLLEGENLYIEFIYRSFEVDLVVGISALSVKEEQIVDVIP